MNTREQMREAIQSDLSISASSSLYPPATINTALDRAYIKASGLFRWPALQDSLKTVTELNGEYYNAPDNWRPNSMWRITVDGNVYGQDPDFSPYSFHDFLDWKNKNPNSDLKRWAVQWLRYFLNPIPTVAGLEICVWGIKNAVAMTEDDDVTIFSSNMPEGNEAIVLEAKAILQKKGNKDDVSEFSSSEAKQILIIAFDKIMKEGAKIERIQPGFSVPNFYGPTSNQSLTGKFNTQV